MLAKLDVGHVIVGHSERRELFGETDDSVNKKVKAVIANSMVPILCCGETLEERQQSMAEAKVQGQVREGLAGLSEGDGLQAGDRLRTDLGHRHRARPQPRRTPRRCAPRCARWSAKRMGTERRGRVRVQYGGSVKPGNIVELMSQPDIDGATGGRSVARSRFLRCDSAVPQPLTSVR